MFLFKTMLHLALNQISSSFLFVFIIYLSLRITLIILIQLFSVFVLLSITQVEIYFVDEFVSLIMGTSTKSLTELA